MSKHDPFDGQYDDDGSAGVAASHPEAGMAAEQHAEPQSEPQPELTNEDNERETYTMGWLRRQDKDDLQAIAADRGLDTSGTRDALITRIVSDQATH